MKYLVRYTQSGQAELEAENSGEAARIVREVLTRQPLPRHVYDDTGILVLSLRPGSVRIDGTRDEDGR